MKSIISWVIFDGTKKTLPNENTNMPICGDVLCIRQEEGFTKIPLAMELYFDIEGEPCWKKGMTFWRAEKGDMWAYIPTEIMK